jgi:uncharacterized protein with HEPN domain
MPRPDDRDAAFLWDMLTAFRTIEAIIAEQSEADVAGDVVLRSAFHWQVIVIGEAARRVSRPFREATPSVDWLLLFRQRNFYAHEYDEADPGDLLVFVATDLPEIARAVESLLPSDETP